MANVQFSVQLGIYCSLIRSLQQSETLGHVIDALRENAHIINDEDVPPYIVHVKIDSSYIGTIVSHVLRGSNIITSDADALMTDFKDRLEEDCIAAEKQSAHEKWLHDCFSKYVIDDETPTCKELAVLINRNELKPGMDRVKYQGIMKQLRLYRDEKFGNK